MGREHDDSQATVVRSSASGGSSQTPGGVILTPDQRIRVFISSTLEELADERSAARRAVERLRLVPVWYESGARPHPPRSMYQAYLEQSQVFVGIYWQRYGWVAPGMDISGLEDEYRLAAGKPMLLYLKRPAPDQEPRLSAFIDGIRAAGTVSYRTFATPKDLERLLADDLAVLLSERFDDATQGMGASPAGPGASGGAGLPSGTVTFLFTDIEGSTRLWERQPSAMALSLALHDEILRTAFTRNGGQVVSAMGDGMAVAFPSVQGAARAALGAQRALVATAWPPETGALKVRMGLHTDSAELRDGQYVNRPLNRCARIMAVAHGGQILLSDATEALVRSELPGDTALLDLGEHHLRDLSEPVHLFQLVHPDLPHEFPPLRSLEAPPGNLPLPTSSFIGRAHELAQTATALTTRRLVTLTGVGGVGKTRLALEVARQVSPGFGDGAWLCELASVGDPEDVADAVAAVFSVTVRSAQSAIDTLVEYLRHKDVLLVIDNCEHVLAGVATLAGVLKQSCAQLAILATSREGLGIDGERLIPVPPLAAPTDDADLETTLEADAVRLFVERAVSVKPDFSVTGDNAAAVAAVCRQLDGVPLAIELAAARVPTMTAAELARRLDRRFSLLGGRRGALKHHQTLRATMDWSFDLLTEAEQRLLVRLSVFAGGCTLEAVEAVCGGEGIDLDAVFELLANLVARSLVVADVQGPASRYRLLETVRQYGAERLADAGEVEWWRARHGNYYAGFIGEVREQAHDPRNEVFWALRLAVEQDNLLAAWSWAIETGNVDTAFEILAGFAPCEVWNSYPLLLAAETALGLPGATEHPRYPLALAVSAIFASNRSDVTGAEDLCRRASEANGKVAAPDWRVEEAVCAARQNIATTTGAFGEAARLAVGAAGIARDGGDLADASVELSSAAACHVLAGDAPRGVPLALEALALARQVGAPALVATCLLEVGATVAEDDPAQARACLHESLDLSSALGFHKARDLVWAAGIATLIGDRVGSLDLCRRAIRGLQPSGDRLRTAITFHMIANTLAATQPEAAAIIEGAAEVYVAQPEPTAQLLASKVAAALGDEHARDLRLRGTAMDWDQAVSFAVSQITQALTPRTGP